MHDPLTFRIRSTTFGTRKPKVSNTNGIENVDCQNTLSHVWSLGLKRLRGLSVPQ